MVMCGGGLPERDKGHHYYRATLVYFPSQDAISPSVIRGGGGIGATMWPSSNKRKLEPEVEDQTYFNQRQSILDISMIKLRTQPIRRTELPLRRSVLIFNTLKTIESELSHEGVRWNPASRPSLIPSLEPNDVTLDPVPGDVKPQDKHAVMDAACKSPLAAPPQDDTASMTGEQYSDTRSILDSLFNLPVSQTGPLPTFSSLLDLDTTTSSSSSTAMETSTAYTTTTSSSPHLPVPPSSSSSSQQHSTSRQSPLFPSSHHHHHHHYHSDHDLFNEFDFSSLDVDFFSFLPSNLKLPPLSPEDLQSLPHAESYSQSLPTSCNPKHTDLLGDDLDSIMQILVGI